MHVSPLSPWISTTPNPDKLIVQGLRSICKNLVHDADIPDANALTPQTFFNQLRVRSFHLKGDRILHCLADQRINLVIDHFNLLTDPHLHSGQVVLAVAGLTDRQNLCFKFSAHNQTAFDIPPHTRALLEYLHERRVV